MGADFKDVRRQAEQAAFAEFGMTSDEVRYYKSVFGNVAEDGSMAVTATHLYDSKPLTALDSNGDSFPDKSNAERLQPYQAEGAYAIATRVQQHISALANNTEVPAFDKAALTAEAKSKGLIDEGLFSNSLNEHAVDTLARAGSYDYQSDAEKEETRRGIASHFDAIAKGMAERERIENDRIFTEVEQPAPSTQAAPPETPRRFGPQPFVDGLAGLSESDQRRMYMETPGSTMPGYMSGFANAEQETPTPPTEAQQQTAFAKVESTSVGATAEPSTLENIAFNFSPFNAYRQGAPSVEAPPAQAPQDMGPPAPVAKADEPKNNYTIKDGDSLSNIIANHYKDAGIPNNAIGYLMVREAIEKANNMEGKVADKKFGIALAAGTEINLPSADVVKNALKEGNVTYEVAQAEIRDAYSPSTQIASKQSLENKGIGLA